METIHHQSSVVTDAAALVITLRLLLPPPHAPPPPMYAPASAAVALGTFFYTFHFHIAESIRIVDMKGAMFDSSNPASLSSRSAWQDVSMLTASGRRLPVSRRSRACGGGGLLKGQRSSRTGGKKSEIYWRRAEDDNIYSIFLSVCFSPYLLMSIRGWWYVQGAPFRTALPSRKSHAMYN